VLGDYLFLWKTSDSGFINKFKKIFFWFQFHINGTRNLIPSLLLQKENYGFNFGFGLKIEVDSYL
jgi:hypothetical protein